MKKMVALIQLTTISPAMLQRKNVQASRSSLEIHGSDRVGTKVKQIRQQITKELRRPNLPKTNQIVASSAD